MDIAGALAELGQRKLAGLPLGDRGQVLEAPAAGKVLVNCNGSPELVWCPIDYPVTVGDRVIVQRNGPDGYVAGRLDGSRVLPVLGSVTAAPGGSTTITVAAGADSYTLPFAASYAPTVGDQVRITWEGGTGVVLCKMGATPVPPAAPVLPMDAPTPPAAPAGPPGTGSSRFPATAAASWRGGKWRTDSAVVAQGSYGTYGANSGAWFYSGGPGAMLRGATVTGCAVRVQRISGGDYAAQTVHLYLHTSDVRPAGDVTRTLGPTDFLIGRGSSAWVPLPVSWGQAIVDSGGGIAITGNPYLNLAGLDTDSQSGLLQIDWTR